MLNCSVPSCKNRHGMCLPSGQKIRFFTIPKKGLRRKQWLTLINRSNWTPYNEARVCEVITFY